MCLVDLDKFICLYIHELVSQFLKYRNEILYLSFFPPRNSLSYYTNWPKSQNRDKDLNKRYFTRIKNVFLLDPDLVLHIVPAFSIDASDVSSSLELTKAALCKSEII